MAGSDEKTFRGRASRVTQRRYDLENRRSNVRACVMPLMAAKPQELGHCAGGSGHRCGRIRREPPRDQRAARGLREHDLEMIAQHEHAIVAHRELHERDRLQNRL
jgi:hypothetical protein